MEIMEFISSKPWTNYWDEFVPKDLAEKIPEQGIGEYVEQGMGRFSDRKALVYLDETITYKDLQKYTNNFAASLYEQGFSKGDVFGLLLPNVPQFVIALYGAWKAGLAVAQLNPALSPEEIEHQLKDSNSKVIITTKEVKSAIEPLLPKTAVKKVILTTPKDAPFFKPEEMRADSFASMISGERTLPKIEISPDAPAIILYTSGTTGLPKRRLITCRGIVAVAECEHEWYGPSEFFGKEVILSPWPPSHGVATLYAAMAPRHGATTVIAHSFAPKDVCEMIEKNSVTLVCGLPPIYIALAGYRELEKHDFSSVRVCMSAGGMLPTEVRNEIERKMGPVRNWYGSQDVGWLALDPTVKGTPKPESSGFPTPLFTLATAHIEENRILPIGEYGELVAAGPSLERGDFKLPDEEVTEVIFTSLGQKWLRTGDAGFIDENGFVYVVDRAKEMIKKADRYIAPSEIEDILIKHSAVKDAAIVGVEEKGETRIKGFVSLHEGKEATQGELMEHCKKYIAEFECPDSIDIIARVPRTASGKLLRRVLKG
jgi:long-chain acyl-CoA synthetase